MRHNVSKEEGVQVVFPFDGFWKIYDLALEKTGRYTRIIYIMKNLGKGFGPDKSGNASENFCHRRPHWHLP